MVFFVAIHQAWKVSSLNKCKCKLQLLLIEEMFPYSSLSTSIIYSQLLLTVGLPTSFQNLLPNDFEQHLLLNNPEN